MCGTFVRIWLSTVMNPRSETATPALSAPIFPPFGLRPTLISTASYGCGSFGAFAPSNVTHSASDFAADRGGLGPDHHPVEARLVELLPDPDEVAIRAGHEAVEHFDDVEPGAERRVNRSHFETDDAAADHEHPLRHRLEEKRARRIEDAWIVRNERQAHRLRPGGDDRLLEADDGFLAGCRLSRSLGELDFDVVRIEELAEAANDFDLARLRHAGEPAGELAHDFVLPAAKPLELDLRCSERDPMLRERLRLVHYRCDVQERLRRYAAHIEAHAAERAVALDQHRLHAEIRSAECRAVATRSGTEHQHPAFDVRLARVGRCPWNRRGRRCGLRGGRRRRCRLRSRWNGCGR
jgi:hypothetical protein